MTVRFEYISKQNLLVYQYLLKFRGKISHRFSQTQEAMRKQSHTLIKVFLASIMLSVVCSITLKVGTGACATATDIKILVRTVTTDTTGTSVCINPTDSEYVAASGCKFYLINSDAALAGIATTPVVTKSFACDGGVRLQAPVSGSCSSLTGYTLVQARKATSGTNVPVCVKALNTVAAPELAKGCQYYLVADVAASSFVAGSLPDASNTFVCTGGYSLSAVGSGCPNGFANISVQPNGGGTAVNACISTKHSSYLTSTYVGCAYYELAASVATSPYPILTATLTCKGISLSAVGSGCPISSELVQVRTSAKGPSVSACIKTGNSLYSAPTCSYYLVAPSTNLAVFPIISNTLTCGGITLKTGGTCAIGQALTKVKTSSVGATTAVCVSSTNSLYVDKGCGYFLITPTIDTTDLPVSTQMFSCVGITLGSSICLVGVQTSVKVRNSTSGSSVSSCVNNQNALYVPESLKGCGYFLVDSSATVSSLPSLSETFICKGVSMSIKDATCASTQVSIKVRASVADTDSTVCVSKTNPLYIAAGSNCLFYLVDSGTVFTAASTSNTMTCGSNAGLTAPSDTGTCPSGKVLISVTNTVGGTAVKACYDETDPLYAVENCESYLVTVVAGSGTFPNLPLNTTTLTCTCGSTTTQSVKNLVDLTKKACIPNTQWRVNCDIYKKTSLGQYTCTGCQQGASFIVSLGKDTAGNNDKNYTDACTPVKVPGCQTYGLFLKTAADGTKFDGAGTAYTNAVGCMTCLTGNTAWAASTGTFLFWTSTAGQVGKACPVDGSIDSVKCTKIKLFNGAYVCDACSNPTYEMMTNYYDASSKLTVGCLIKGTASVTYLNIDPDCNLFSWGNADFHTGFTCIRCKSQFILKDIYDYTSKKTYSRCIPSTTFITPNCKDLLSTDLKDYPTPYQCLSCLTGFEKIKTRQIPGSLFVGICAKSGRFALNTGCSLYDSNMNFDMIFALKCSSCIGGVPNPCQASCTPGVTGAGTTKGFSAQNNQATPGQICVTSDYVDNCVQYSMITIPAKNGQSGDNDCIKCATGFDLVTTSATKTNGQKGKICITNDQKITNCNIYNNADLACYDCKDKLGFDRNTWKCRGPTDVSASCTKGVMVGDKLVCITCPIGYTLKDGACVTAVPFCASLSSTGVCSACVQPNNYQLVNNKCILKPANCAIVNENGACTACKPGFLLTVDKACAVTSSNTCPPGQFLSNGVCVTGTIANCQTYDRNGKCDTCKTGFTLSTNGKECTASSSGSSNRYPNAPPCPPDTNKFKYVRNPSDPNGPCVPVDVQCANPRDDGHCITCKDGEFAHTDGLCYKIIFPSN